MKYVYHYYAFKGNEHVDGIASLTYEINDMETHNKFKNQIGEKFFNGNIRFSLASLTLLSKVESEIDCNDCANRGRINGLSQETFCGSCIYAEKWRENHFKQK